MKCIIEEDARGFKHLETTGIRNMENRQCTGYKYKVEQTPQHILWLKFKTENLQKVAENIYMKLVSTFILYDGIPIFAQFCYIFGPFFVIVPIFYVIWILNTWFLYFASSAHLIEKKIVTQPK